MTFLIFFINLFDNHQHIRTFAHLQINTP